MQAFVPHRFLHHLHRKSNQMYLTPQMRRSNLALNVNASYKRNNSTMVGKDVEIGLRPIYAVPDWAQGGLWSPIGPTVCPFFLGVRNQICTGGSRSLISNPRNVDAGCDFPLKARHCTCSEVLLYYVSTNCKMEA